MSGLIRAITTFVLPIPTVLATLALIRGFWPLFFVAGFMAAIYAVVWLWWRPNRFEIHGDRLLIVFPWRQLSVPLSSVLGARKLSQDAFRQEFGFAARIGAGGLWGGFGWLWTQRRGMVEMYISRQDDYVLIERREALPLLLTPAGAEPFIAAVHPDRQRH